MAPALPWHSTPGSGSAWLTSLRQHPGASPGTLLLPVEACSPAGLGQDGWCPGFHSAGLHQDSAAQQPGLLSCARVVQSPSVSHKTNASFVSASLHQGMRTQRPAQGH